MDAHGAERPAGSLARAWELAKLGAFGLWNLAYMLFRTKIVFRFWWYHRTGRDAKVEEMVARLTLDWARRVFTRFRCAVEVQGAEHVPLEGPLIVMCNHQSFYDIPLLFAYLGRPTGFVLKKELYRIPGLAFWMRRIHCRGLDRQDRRTAAGLFDRWGEEIVAGGQCIVVFPEGTRTRDPEGRIGPFRRGSLRLAEQCGIPVLPVVIDGTRHFTRPGALARTRRGGRLVRIRFHPPLHPRPMTAPEAKRFTEELRETMISSWRELRVEWPHLPAGQPPTNPRSH